MPLTLKWNPSFRHVHDSHRISNQVRIFIVHYSVELSPSPVCVAAIHRTNKGRRSGESAVTASWRRIVGCAERASFQLHSSSIHGTFILVNVNKDHS